MRLTFAVAALCAVPALATEYPKGGDHVDYHIEEISVKGTSKNTQHLPHRPVKPHPEHEGDLTEYFVCERLNFFAGEADYIYDLVDLLECGEEYDRCWEPVRKALYQLEYGLDLFDTSIDKSDLSKCWSCRQESKIACCYKTYAESLIRALGIIAEKTAYLDGETDKYILTAVNSLRSADYTFVYELVRRMQCEEYEKEIMKKQGAPDGSTKGSIREAFALLVSTPYITGEDFEGKQH